MAIEIVVPNDFSQYITPNKLLMFAGGSIEMDKAKQWQRKLVAAFKNDNDVVILNPRRPNWNPKLKQKSSNKEFVRQVDWELNGFEAANVILMNYDPATISPICLLETGLFAFDWGCQEPKLHVVCPNGYWRKGNIDIICKRYGIPQFLSLGAFVKHIKQYKKRFMGYER